MTAPDIVKIRARIRALLAKTIENGCTEAEATTAASRARELMSEYGLTEDAVLGFAIMEYRVRITKATAETDCLISAIALICSCKVWTSTKEIREAVYFGYEPDTLIAEYLHGVAFGAVERARAQFRQSPEYKRRRSQKTRTLSMKAFVKGFVDGLWRKLYFSQSPDPNRLAKVEQALAAKEMSFFATSRPKKDEKTRASFQAALEQGYRQGRAIEISTGMATPEAARQIGWRGGAE